MRLAYLLNSLRIQSIFLIFTLFAVFHANGQSLESHEHGGSPFGLQHYTKEDLPNQGQNWSVVEDRRGVIYVGNNYGVLEYDGSNWRLIKIADQKTAFALGRNEAGIVFVGSREDLGYLAPDRNGIMTYRSLLEHVEDKDREFGIIWNIVSTSEGIYFQGNAFLFRWDGTDMKVWRSDDRLHTSFAVHDRFYVKKDNTGLLVADQDSLTLVQGGERFADRRVFFMGGLGEDVLVGAQKGMHGLLELYRFDGASFLDFPIDSHLRPEPNKYTFYHGSVLPNGYYALGTLYNGLFIVDEEGKMADALNLDRGVVEDVNYTYSDFQGGLWLAHNVSGVSYIASPVKLSQFGNREGLSGAVNAVLRHQDRLYVATDAGLYRLRSRFGGADEDASEHFEMLDFSDNAQGIHWALLSYGESLIASAEHGVVEVRGNQSKTIGFESPARPGALYKSNVFTDRIYVGLDPGIGILRPDGAEWISESLPTDIFSKVSTIVEAPDGTLWVGTVAPGEIWRLKFDTAGNITEHVQVTDSKQLDVPYVEVGYFGGEVGILAMPKGIFLPKQQEAGETVELVLDQRYTRGNALPSEEQSTLVDVVGISDDAYWAVYNDRVELAEVVEGEHIRTELPSELMLPTWSVFKEIFVEESGDAWLSSASARPLIKFDADARENLWTTEVREVLIRGVSIMGGDSTLYGGAFSSQAAAVKFEKGKNLSIDLDHKDNDLRFEYILPNYNRQAQVEYQYFLEGHDKLWSDWTTEDEVIYRNIEPGILKFQVKAKIGGVPLDHLASMSLRIKAPWFWSWWSKILYLLFFGFSAFQFVKYQRAKKDLVLLNIERELNARLQLANTQLRTANDSLEQANRMKDEFLANASHELRTPLTAILGFTSVLKEEVPQENLEFLGLIDENGKRLLRTINSLLDLAKLRAGMLELNFQRLNIGQKTEEVVDLLAQLAKNQDLTLEIKQPPEHILVRLDAHCYERILYNLIGNAIKFTKVGGVTVEIERVESRVLVHVIDTGVGIDESFVPLLFDEFKQEPNNEIRSDGSGLGLTITAKLVELLNGKISVESEKGKGSTFTVSFRIDDVQWDDRNDNDRDYRSEGELSTVQSGK